jgi:hypothetical protein
MIPLRDGKDVEYQIQPKGWADYSEPHCHCYAPSDIKTYGCLGVRMMLAS